MSTSRAGLDVRLRALLLSRVVTRLVKAPQVELAARDVPQPEELTAPTRHGPVRCLITRPARDAPLAGAPRPPVHVNIHGGAFLIGAPRQDDHLVRLVAGEVGAVVVNVDYSTAPRARFPRALEECFDVLQWVITVAAEMGWDGERVSIGGGSAGGRLALGVLQLAAETRGPRPVAAVLVAPIVDATLPPESYAIGEKKAFVTPALIRTINASYYADASQLSDPLASPVLGTVAAMPPLLVIAAERDSLRPQIERYTARAFEAGVDVTYRCLEGVDHDFPISRSHRVRIQQLLMLELVRDHLLKHLS